MYTQTKKILKTESKGESKMKFKEFKDKNFGCYCLVAVENDLENGIFIGDRLSLLSNCDDMLVVDYLYQPLNGRYTVYLKNK